MNSNSLSARLAGTGERMFLPAVIVINLIIKAIAAGILELGNDEAYYWTYAMFPDWSHFDHPPMVGFIIQYFTLNLTLHSELFIRAGALVLSSANIIILFYLVRRVSSVLAAYIAVIMYIASFYFNLISGLFILPDAPQMFFVILSLYYVLPSLTEKNPTRRDQLNIILFGLFTGLAFLSKYHSLFLWFGAGLYILLINRIWFKKPSLYLSMACTVLLSLPVLYWNYKNNFISFTYHENRIGLLHSPINYNSFLQFNLGEFFYQNPFLSVAYTITLYKIFSLKRRKIPDRNILLLFLALPLILIFTLLSLFHTTLPHWSGPAFICLIILSSEYLADNYDKMKRLTAILLSGALAMFFLILIAGTIQIKTGFIRMNNDDNSIYMGRNDFTLDMFGWAQAREKFKDFLKKEGISEYDHNRLAIVSNKWFTAAHLDYYIAYPLHIKLIAVGSIENIHKYFWIDKTRTINKTDRVFYLTDSRNYKGPEEYLPYCKNIIPLDTLTIFRSNKAVRSIYIYDMEDFRASAAINSLVP